MPPTANKKQAKILSFHQPGDFFFRRGMSKLDKNNLLDAIAFYRQAAEKEPENTDFTLAVAEVLTEMDRYEESNRIILSEFPYNEENYERLFDLACNFMGMQDYEKARDSFYRYIKSNPDGEYVQDAIDIMEAFEEDGLLNDILPEDSDREASEASLRARQLIEQEDYKAAIQLLNTALKKHPSYTFLRNNLALAYFCNKEYDKAMEETGAVLNEMPDNIQAHCNVAIFLKAAKNYEGLKNEIKLLADMKSGDMEDMSRVALTLIDLEQYSSALTILKQLFAELPYNTEITHRMGLCYYMCDNYSEAKRCYERLLKINANDTVAKYYRDLCKNVMAGGIKITGITASYQVPEHELIRRLNCLTLFAKKTREQKLSCWKNDREITDLLFWAAELPSLGVKRTVLSIIVSFADRQAERFLRDFVLRRNQPDELKRDAFALLKQMRAKEPFLGYIDNKLVESRVEIIQRDTKLPAAYMKALALCDRKMEETGESVRLRTYANNLFNEYVKGLREFAKLNSGAISAFAAALHFITAASWGGEADEQKIIEEYGVSQKRLYNFAKKLEEANRSNIDWDRDGI